MVSQNLGLVWSVVRKFSNRGYENDDLFQLGSIGLLKAIDNFDPVFGVQFSTYAVPMIMGEIKRFMRDDGIIKVSRSVKELAIRIKTAVEIFEKKKGRAPTMSELAENVDAKIEDIVFALDACALPDSLYKNDDDLNAISLIDKLEDNSSSEEDIVDKITLNQVIGNLKCRDRQIIVMRYYKGLTKSQIEKQLGISQVQVSRIEKKVLESMKNTLTC